ncbi:HAMP domain-containing histidine kinase [Bacteroides thetaiotaomicron]|nr:HAMP domain-containing histidine kinase [Bacteroides thetaiotaomicron]
MSAFPRCWCRRKGGISEEKQEYINIIENNNTLLLQLISDVLDLSKIEAGTMEFDYAPVDVHGLFIELEDTFRLRNKKSGICICYHRRTTECVVKADRNRLVQVMMNLMNNAVKFTGEGSIEFGFDVREDGFLHFYVTDTGCGIPEERLEEIFGNFVKLNSFVQGTGLGLTICRAIVERMGGKIGAVSRLGQGSTFLVHAALYGQRREGLKGTWRDGNILASRRMGLFSQPLPEGRGSHADSQLESRLPQETGR